MIVEYAPDGRILHIINDPVPPHIEEFLSNSGATFISFPPIPWPSEPVFDSKTGEQLFEKHEIHATDPDSGEPIFDPVTGEPVITTVLGNPILQSNGVDSVQCDIGSDYILDGAITPRPQFGFPATISVIADGKDTAILGGLPSSCEVIIDGEPMVIEGGELRISSDMPAEYEIRFVQWPYIEQTVKAISHAPNVV